VICSAVLSAGGAIIVALVKYMPQRQQTRVAADAEDKCHRRMSALETRVAVMETNHVNIARSLDEFRKELHEMRIELRQLIGRTRGTGEP
jgi:uncharacterized coiled-coil protein SlyX